MLAAISTGCSIPELESNFFGIFHGIWGAGFCWFVASLGMSASCRPTRAVVSLYFAMVCNNTLLLLGILIAVFFQNYQKIF